MVLACLKVINRFRKKKTSNSKAQEDIKNIEKIVLAKVEPINDDIDTMIQSIQSSLVGVFGSCRCYIEDRYGPGSIDEPMVQAIEAEKWELGGGVGTYQPGRSEDTCRTIIQV